MTAGVVPISDDERKARIAKAQKLMTDQKMDAIFMEGTTSCFYYVGMRWGQSERTFGVVIPAKGPIAYVCPGFEEDRARELIKPAFGDEVRVWQEDESPYSVIANIVKDRGVQFHRIGIEERVRFFIADGVRKAFTGGEIADATPVTAGCRMIKTKAEIALMQHANNVTIAAYKAGLQTLREGMSQDELNNNINTAYRRLGYNGAIARAVRQVDGAAARQLDASETPRRRRRHDRRRDHGARATRRTSRGRSSSASRRSGRRTCGRPSSARADGRVQRDQDRRRRARTSTPPRARSSPTPASAPATRCRACPTAPATAWASTATSGRTS